MSELNLGIEIKASPDQVYAALIEPAMLTEWFAEHVDISLDQARFDFWGRHTPENPNRQSGRHKVLRSVENRLLEFEWNLRSSESVVQFEVQPSSKGSILTMYHRDFPEAQPNQSSIGDFWSHSLEGLRHLIEKGQAYSLLDYGSEQKGDVTVAIDINVAPSIVFHALTDAAQMERWMGSKGSIDPRPGGKIDFGWGMGPVKILEIVADEKLSYSWHWEGEPDTVTTWTLDGSGGKTRVTIVHSGFAPDRNSEDYYIGWCKFAARLKSVLEEGADWERVRVYANKERSSVTTTTIDTPDSDK